MEFQEVVATRRSIRKFKDEKVPAAAIEAILRAAMMAPSAGNQRPWEFLVISSKAMLSRIPEFHPYAKMVESAPAAILVCGTLLGIKYPAFWPQDCSAAVQNMLLAARDLGLGSVWAGIYPEEGRIAGCRKLFGIPETVVPFALVVLGWPDQEFKAVDRFEPARVHHEKW